MTEAAAAARPSAIATGESTSLTGTGFEPGEKVLVWAHPGDQPEFSVANGNGQTLIVRSGDDNPIGSKNGRLLVVTGSSLSVQISGLAQGAGGAGGGTAANPNGYYLMTAVDRGEGEMASPAIGGVDLTGATESSLWITNFPYAGSEDVVHGYSRAGAVTVRYPVIARDEFVDCASEKSGCVLYLRVDHRLSSNRSFDVRLPITFVDSAARIPSSAVDLGFLVANAAGQVATDWQPSTDFPLGATSVVLTGQSSGRTAVADLSITAAKESTPQPNATAEPTPTTSVTASPSPTAIELSQGRVAVGDLLTITGSGFTGTVSLTLHSDPIALRDISADAAGRFQTSVQIPAVTSGVHRIVAADLAGNRAEYPITVDPAELSAMVDPAEARRGQQVTVSGTGFEPGERVVGSIVGTVPATSSISTSNGNGQAMTVRSAGRAPIANQNGTLIISSGTAVSVSISGLSQGGIGTGGGTRANPNGYYLMVAAEVPGAMASPAIGGLDMSGASGGSAWLTNSPYPGSEDVVSSISESGSAHTTLVIQSGDEFVNCSTATHGCVLYLRVDHRQAGNRDFDLKLPIRFAPADQVRALARGTEVIGSLGGGTANAAGQVSFEWTVPTDQPLGEQPVTLTGDNSGRSAGTSLTVLTVTGEAGGLAATGLADSTWLTWTGVILLLTGGLTWYWGRSGRRSPLSRAH